MHVGHAELAVEPSCSEESSIFSNEDEASTSLSDERKEKLVIKKPERKKKRQEITNETLSLIKSAIKNDHTKEKPSFLKDESEKAQEHELKMMQMLSQSSNAPQRQQEQHYGYSFRRNNQDPQSNTRMPLHAQSLCQENVWQPGFPTQPFFKRTMNVELLITIISISGVASPRI